MSTANQDTEHIAVLKKQKTCKIVSAYSEPRKNTQNMDDV